MNITSFHLPKPNEEGRTSEDYHWINPEILGGNNQEAINYPRLVAVLSDGAGGVGLFAAEWAKQLTHWVVENFAEKPITAIAEFETIIINNWQAFQDEQISKLSKESAQFDKFTTQGSYATILALWQTYATSFHVFGIGDSCLIKVTENEVQVFPEEYSNTELFAQAPTLISLYEPLEVRTNTVYAFTVQQGDKLIMATDSVSEHCINELKGNKPSLKLDIWIETIGLKNERTIKSYFMKRFQDKTLKPDDYSFILITL